MFTRSLFTLLGMMAGIVVSALGEIPTEPAKVRNDVKVIQRLPILGLEASKHQIELIEAADQWQPNGHSWLQGNWGASDIRLDDLRLKTEEIAAIFSSSSPSRTRVFMRDGKVLLGKLTFQDAYFVSEQLGRVKLSSDHFGNLMLRSRKTDREDEKVAAWVMDVPSGRIIPMTSLPKTTRLTYQTMWATFPLTWDDIQSVHTKSTAPLVHQLHLKNGSILVGWARWKDAGLPHDTCYAWARQQTQLASLLTGAPESNSPTENGLYLSDGSLIKGTPEDSSTSWLLEKSEIQLPFDHWIQVKKILKSTHENDPQNPAFVIKTDHQTWTVRPQCETLSWRCEGQKLLVPWRDVERIEMRNSSINKPSLSP